MARAPKTEEKAPWKEEKKIKGAEAFKPAPVEEAPAKKKAPLALKLPKSLAACADLYSDLRDERLAKDKEAAVLKEKEEFVKNFLIDNIPKSEAKGIAGQRAQVTIVRKTIPQLKDWDAFTKGILKSKDFSLLNRAINKKAIEERWEAGKAVAGVESFETVTLSLHKLK